jgi:hypothetical protein
MTDSDMSEELKDVSKTEKRGWLRDPGLRKLNLGIVFMFASSAGTGYNGSLINGLLVLPECKSDNFWTKSY